MRIQRYYNNYVRTKSYRNNNKENFYCANSTKFDF